MRTLHCAQPFNSHVIRLLHVCALDRFVALSCRPHDFVEMKKMRIIDGIPGTTAVENVNPLTEVAAILARWGIEAESWYR